MICGLLTQLALSAVLLGHQELKVEKTKNSVQKYCIQNEPSNANAQLTFKDAKGDVVLERKIRIAEFDHYNNGDQSGADPAKEASILFKYPRTKTTSTAETVELKLLSGRFQQTARLETTKKKKHAAK